MREVLVQLVVLAADLDQARARRVLDVQFRPGGDELAAEGAAGVMQDAADFHDVAGPGVERAAGLGEVRPDAPDALQDQPGPRFDVHRPLVDPVPVHVPTAAGAGLHVDDAIGGVGERAAVGDREVRIVGGAAGLEEDGPVVDRTVRRGQPGVAVAVPTLHPQRHARREVAVKDVLRTADLDLGRGGHGVGDVQLGIVRDELAGQGAAGVMEGAADLHDPAAARHGQVAALLGKVRPRRTRALEHQPDAWIDAHRPLIVQVSRHVSDAAGALVGGQ